MASGDALLSVDELQQEWFEENGWAAHPPAEVVAYWRQVAADAAGNLALHGGDVAPQTETVIGAELPDMVVIPAHPRLDGSAGFDIELWQIEDDPVLVAYSAVADLVEQLGEDQPWVLLPVSAVREVYSGLPIVLDPSPGITSGRWTRSRLDALQEALSDD